MPDIAMCSNAECPRRGECYRFRATPSERQSYSLFHISDTGSCKHFSQISETERKILDERDRQLAKDDVGAPF